MFLTILVALQFKESKSTLPGFRKVHVTITNNMTYQLGVDCKDKNYDFGYQVIKFGESYTFKFKPTLIIGKSLYFCHFNWYSGEHYFDIYIQKRDQDCGNNCNWVVKESGPCKIKDGSIDCFQWNPNVVA
jgi:hypothetical protein